MLDPNVGNNPFQEFRWPNGWYPGGLTPPRDLGDTGWQCGMLKGVVNDRVWFLRAVIGTRACKRSAPPRSSRHARDTARSRWEETSARGYRTLLRALCLPAACEQPATRGCGRCWSATVVRMVATRHRCRTRAVPAGSWSTTAPHAPRALAPSAPLRCVRPTGAGVGGGGSPAPPLGAYPAGLPLQR